MLLKIFPVINIAIDIAPATKNDAENTENILTNTLAPFIEYPGYTIIGIISATNELIINSIKIHDIIDENIEINMHERFCGTE